MDIQIKVYGLKQEDDTMLNQYLFYSNRNGIPRIETESVTVESSSVGFSVTSRKVFGDNFSGLILVKIKQSIPSGTTGTLPLTLTSASGVKNITTYDGENVTVADYKGVGIYIMYYDSNTGVLQLVG